MTAVEIILICFILLIGVISMFSDSAHAKYQTKKKDEDPNLARLRQMQEWDRFDDNRKDN